MYIGILGSTTHKADSNTTGGREAPRAKLVLFDCEKLEFQIYNLDLSRLTKMS